MVSATAAPAREIVAVKKRIASGEIPGPTLHVAGPALTKGGNPNAVQTVNVAGAADARAKTRQLTRTEMLKSFYLPSGRVGFVDDGSQFLR